jgi:uncharacterized protein (UPF0335 family)
MTNEAQRHLIKAMKLLAKGDGFYAQAADEIIAAQKADPTLTNKQIGATFGRSRDWVRILVAWRTTDEAPRTPFSEPKRESPDVRGTKRILREAPLEQVEQIIESLPEDRKLAVAAAAGSGYHRERLKENERVKNLTPAEKKEIEAAKAGITDPIDKALGGFTALGIVGHIEQATEDLSEMVANSAVTAESIYRIDQAHDLFVTELEVARAMAGLGEESIA